MPVALLALCLAAPAAAAPPDMERDLAGVVDRFYDMDFDGAKAAADALSARRPGHPTGPFYRGVSTYQRWIAEGMRSTDTYRNFEDDSRAAEAAANALMASSPAEAHYYLGATLGFRSRANAAQKRFFRALPDGAAAVKHLKKALALDPSLSDARLGMGMYHYFAARMPAGAKPLAYLLIGEKADRALGLAELWSVANSSGTARMEARSVLSAILSKGDEADWTAAERLLSELMSRYPHNPIFRLRRAYVCERRGDFDAAAALADPDGKWLSTLHPRLRASSRAWALYRAAESRLLQGRPQDAERWLRELEGIPHPRGMESSADFARRFGSERRPTAAPSPAPYFTGY